MTNLIVFPHCDLHLVRDTPQLSSVTLSVFRQIAPEDDTPPRSDPVMGLTNITNSCVFRPFSPYNPVGSRMDSAVTITGTGSTRTIAVDPAATPRITFIVIEDTFRFIVVRVQVHESLESWWFGNRTLTTASEEDFGHTQPSIYARFSDDGNGTDRVGDITGHGFVELTSASELICDIDNRNNRARLRGVLDGETTISGTLLGDDGGNDPVPVRVLDYEFPDADLIEVRKGKLEPHEAHNILFLPEGFQNTNEDRAIFREIVTQTSESLFSAARHEPFPTLKDSFRVYSAFQPSTDDLTTLGFKVKENNDGPQREGMRLPSVNRVDAAQTDFTIKRLVELVGLPLRGESRSRGDLLNLWESQSLPIGDFDAFRSRAGLLTINAWKATTAEGILEARDTAFGLIMGQRPADQRATLHSRISGTNSHLIPNADPNTDPPIADDPTDTRLPFLVAAVYRWFRTSSHRTITCDPRRHPPEIYKANHESPGHSVMRYIGALGTGLGEGGADLGQQWVPDPTAFVRSRGLIAMILKDHIIGGTNFNGMTITGQTIRAGRTVEVVTPPGTPANKTIRRRRFSKTFIRKREGPGFNSDEIEPSYLRVENTVGHEFGHSFNLGDEYEETEGDAPDDADTSLNYDGHDNIANHFTARLLPVDGRKIDPTKIKWLSLPRMTRSARLVEPAQANGNDFVVRISPAAIGQWKLAQANTETVNLRAWDPTTTGQQLESVREATGLSIGNIDEANGTLRLTGGNAGSAGAFPTGSVVYVQRTAEGVGPLTVVEPKVLGFLNSTNLPMNRDDDVEKINDDQDKPKNISDFKPPCDSSTLIGVYEGTFFGTGKMYRPAGDCKMRNSGQAAFCHVCKWLITNRVDPSYHAFVDRTLYPEAKKNG